MQSSLIFTCMLLSTVAAVRVKTNADKFSSSSQARCGPLARWICTPDTYKENMGQVRKCCKAKDVSNENLRKACCKFAGMDDEGIQNKTNAEIVVEKPPGKRSEVDVFDGEVEVNDEITSPGSPVEDIVVDDSAPSPKLDVDVVNELNDGIWRSLDVEINPEKKLVQAFYSNRKPGLSWAMSSVQECEDACAKQGGECQAIQSEEDCRKAASDLGKSFAPLITQQDKDTYPIGCFVKAGKANANRVRWNPPLLGSVKITSVCGCYK